MEADTTTVSGYLVSERTSLTVTSDHCYRVEQGTEFCLRESEDNLYCPTEESITVYLTSSTEDEFDRAKTNIKDKVKELLTNSGLNNVHVNVLPEKLSAHIEERIAVVEDPTPPCAPPSTRSSWLCCISSNTTVERRQSYGRLMASPVNAADKDDIKLRVSVPKSISEKDQNITGKTLSDYLASLGYNTTSFLPPYPLITTPGKLKSKEVVDLHLINEEKAHVPQGTKFHFHTKGGNPFLVKVYEPHAFLCTSEQNTHAFTVPTGGLILQIVPEMTASLYYYFDSGTILPNEPLSPQSIHAHLSVIYQSEFQPQNIYVHVVTFSTSTSQSTSGQFNLIGLNVKITDASTITPSDVQSKLQSYFNQHTPTPTPPPPIPYQVLPPPEDSNTTGY